MENSNLILSLFSVFVSLSTFLGIFIPLFLNRKRELLDETLDLIISENWSSLKNSEAQSIFSHRLYCYEQRFKNLVSSKISITVSAIFISSSFMSLFFLIKALQLFGLSFFDNLLTFVACLSILSLLGFLLFSFLFPKFFENNIPSPNRLRDWQYLQNKLGLDFAIIGRKLGFINLTGMLNEKELYFEFKNCLISPNMKFEAYILNNAQKKKIKLIGGDSILPHNVYDNAIVNLSTKEYQICFVIEIKNKSIVPNYVKRIAIVYEPIQKIKSFPKETLHVEFEQIVFGIYTDKVIYPTFEDPEGWSWFSDEWPHFTSSQPSKLLAKF